MDYKINLQYLLANFFILTLSNFIRYYWTRIKDTPSLQQIESFNKGSLGAGKCCLSTLNRSPAKDN